MLPYISLEMYSSVMAYRGSSLVIRRMSTASNNRGRCGTWILCDALYDLVRTACDVKGDGVGMVATVLEVGI